MRSCLEVVEEDEAEADPHRLHLYLLTASDFLTGLVKIGRSHKPFERGLVLAEGLPFHMRIEAIYPFAGAKEQEIHEHLRPFRVEGASSREWFRLSVESANAAIGKILFEPQACATACDAA